jgi:pimeloyl-ACP methyl ester carboxylesterase
MKTLATIFFLLVATCPVYSQDSPEIWKGTLDVRVMQLRLELELNPEGDESPGKLISLDQGDAEMVLDEFSRDGDSISFSIRKMGVEYKGKLDADGKSITGTFKQAGQSFPLKLVKGEKAKPTTHFQTWKGTMDAGGKKFDFQFRVFRDEDDNTTAKLDSFTERVFNLHCDVTHDMSDGSITVEIPVTKATYVGEFSDDMESIKGKWKQSGGEFDLNLESVALEKTREPKAPERPQTPKGPFPYRSKPTTFKNEDAGIKLAGTLTMPKDVEAPPVVILITGSGPQDRDETIADHKPFAVIADHLSRRGIAVLRYDERGVGASEGEFNGATSADLATDVEAAIERLKRRKDINTNQIILAGHSEGGLLAPMIASRRDDVAGVILLAPPGVNGAKIVINQSRLIAEVTGSANQDELDKQERLLGIAFELLKADTAGTDEFYQQFKTKAAEVMGEESKDFELIPQIEVAVRQLDTPWFRFFATYEPVPALSKTSCPVLCMIGSKDLQVDPKLNLPPIRKALTDGGNTDFTIAEMEGMNHLFQDCETGSPAEYGQIEQTISPIALNMMSDWIKKRFGN